MGGNTFRDPLHSPNSNIVERVILTFEDLQRLMFAQSGCPPFWRPVIAISAAQQWAIHRQTVRSDIDAQEICRTPMHWRHSNSYRPVEQATASLCGQPVTVVPPRLETAAIAKPDARGEKRVFMCYYERHGVMDGTILTISLMAALQGGKIFLHRTRDYRVPQELLFPLRQAREWQ